MSNTMHEELVREYAELQADVAPTLARMEEIKKFLRDLDPGTYELAGVKVTISENKTFDEKQFTEDYPHTRYAGLYKLVPDREVIRQHFSPAEREQFQKQGDHRVTIK